MASSIVFKVQYVGTLRRFNVAIDGDQRLDLSMEGLRLKICSLFNLPSDADLGLTYKDEDGDLVTIVDDDDLNDVVRQGLDPVRITVHVNSNQSVQSSSVTSSGSAAPSTPSPQIVLPNVAEIVKSVQETLGHVLNSQQNTNPDVAKIMKSVQEPLSQALSKLSSDMSSKVASTNPILADLFDGLSKMGQSCVNVALSSSGASNISSQSNLGNGSKPSSEVKKHGVSADKGVKNSGIEKVDPMQPAPKSPRATGVGASGKHPLYSPLSLDKGKNVICESSSKKKSSSCGMRKNKDITAQKYDTGLSPVFLKAIPVDASEKESIRDATERIRDGLSYRDPIPGDDYPYIGVPLPPFIIHDQYLKSMHLPNRSLNKADNLGPIFHKGVRCDGCGVLPITGPRFKSKVKYDYDLCGICFSRIGNLVDYTRIDFPLAQGHLRPFMSPDPKSLRQCLMRPHLMRPHASKHPRLRFDSRFIMDVNVMDGTTMAPSTPFIKIWRMRNNGTLPWLHGLKLLYIGGDRISPFDSVEIQVPSTGVDVGHELDIAVDFIAPELPGRYISYWRMAESEHKFGQRVWVQIQVDQSVDLTRESSPILNLNLPPDNNEAPFPEAVVVKPEPGFIVKVGQSSAPPSNLEHDHKTEMVTMNFPTNDDLLLDTGNMGYSTPASPSSSVPPPPAANPDRLRSSVARSSISYPVVQEPSAPLLSYPINGKLPEPSAGPSDVQDAISIFQQISEKTESEDKLLKELAQMGFKEVDLNKDVLRRNEYDLERCVDDLYDVSEWDPILLELKEMGFEDKETNKKLLVKNNGSITRVVMDLIAEENA